MLSEFPSSTIGNWNLLRILTTAASVTRNLACKTATILRALLNLIGIFDDVGICQDTTILMIINQNQYRVGLAAQEEINLTKRSSKDCQRLQVHLQCELH